MKNYIFIMTPHNNFNSFSNFVPKKRFFAHTYVLHVLLVRPLIDTFAAVALVKYPKPMKS